VGGHDVKAARSGNRQINAALYRIAMNQIRRNGPGETYYRRRREAGDSHAAALRRLERRIARRVFSQLRTDHINKTAEDKPSGSLPKPDHATTT
jgi:hypothetical protein